MRRRTRLAIGGVGAAVLAVAFLVVAIPSLSGAISLDGLVEAVGADYLLAAAVGAVACVLVVALVVRRALGGIEQARMPEPETVQHADHPGVRFDRAATGRIRLLPRPPTAEERELRERVRAAAERAVMRRERVSRSDAAATVDRGEWTDDVAAAAFVSDDARPPIRVRLAALFSRRSWYQVGARRAAEEISRVDGGGRAGGSR
jgi:hypothetical protein